MLVVLVAAGTAYMVVMHFASRRVFAGKGRWVWVRHSFLLLAPAFLIYGGWQSLSSVPYLGLLLLAVGVGWLLVAVRMLRRMSREVSTATSPDEIGTALFEPLVDYQLVFVGVTLVGGLIAVVALIVYGVMLAARGGR